MSWFGNRNREGREAERPDIKPRNQILQVPEKETSEAKGKLDRFQDKSPEDQKKSLNEQSRAAKDRQKLERPSNTSTEGDTAKGQRQLERGHVAERE
ncbi:hypothetical protein ABXS75_18710 [Roseburia hominis]